MMLRSMNALDAGLALMESAETPMHIGGLQILSLPPRSGRDYVRRVREQWMRVPADGAPFNYRLAAGAGPLGLPMWEVLDHVDLTEHVYHHALPWPGGERELFALISRLNSGPLDRRKPLWEQHLIEGLSGRRWATFVRVHHALMDGARGVKMAEETSSADRRARGVPPYWGVRFDDPARPEDRADGAKAPSDRGQHQGAPGREGFETLAELRKAFGRLIESYRNPTDDGLKPLYVAPECMLNGKLTPRREVAVAQLDLGRVRRLAHAEGSTVNDVVLAVCGGSLRRYLLARDALPEQPLVANMPIAMARTGAGAGGNAVIPGIVSLATHLADPVQRFEAVRGSSRHVKELFRDLPSQTALSIYLGISGIPFLLAQIAGQAERVHAQTLVISNVRGPGERRYVNGAELLAAYLISLLAPGQATNITVISHGDRLDVAVLVCPSLAPAPHEVADGIAAAFTELERALAPRHRPARRNAPTRKSARRRSRPTLRSNR